MSIRNVSPIGGVGSMYNLFCGCRFVGLLVFIAGMLVEVPTAYAQRPSRGGHWNFAPASPYGDYRTCSPMEPASSLPFDPPGQLEPFVPGYQPETTDNNSSPLGYSGLGQHNADDGCDCPYCQGARFWSARLGTVVLHRSRPHNELLFSNPFNPSEQMNANQFDPGWQAGFDASLTAHNWFGRNGDLEFRFFGIDDWTDTQSLATTGAIVDINSEPTNSIVGPRRIESNFKSNLFSYELVAHSWSARRTWGLLMGARFIQLNEDLDTMFRPDPLAGLADFRYDITTKNDLYGGEVGIEFALVRNCCSCWDGFIKGGLLANNASSGAVATSFVLPPASFPAGGSGTDLAYLVEAGVNGRQKITNHWSLYFGYQILYLNGVALATEQIRSADIVTGTGFNSTSDVFYHGGRIGLEFNY